MYIKTFYNVFYSITYSVFYSTLTFCSLFFVCLSEFNIGFVFVLLLFHWIIMVPCIFQSSQVPAVEGDWKT